MNNEIIEKLDLMKYINAADSCLANMNFTKHDLAHVSRVAKMTLKILTELDCDEHTLELAEIAGYMHDIGNVINRHDHAHSGALLAYQILMNKGYDLSDILQIVSAIGNHDVTTGAPVSKIAAALIIADKSDVRRSRVRKTQYNSFDIHDRVNYAVSSSTLSIEEDTIILKLFLDSTFSSVLEYFEIFSNRMKLCKQAAKFLGLKFKLIINDVELID